MGKQLQFVFANHKWQGGLTKVDRDKVYGYIEEAVFDKDGNNCSLASMLDDGMTVVPSGATALKTVDAHNKEVDKKTLRTVYMDGTAATLVPSSYDGEITLKEVTLNDLFDLEVTSVYQVDFENSADKSVALEILNKVEGLGFVFNYRADYEGADAIVIASQELVFILVGRALQFEYQKNQQALIVEETETVSEEDVDFGML
jgi:hypothetical protein